MIYDYEERNDNHCDFIYSGITSKMETDVLSENETWNVYDLVSDNIGNFINLLDADLYEEFKHKD